MVVVKDAIKFVKEVRTELLKVVWPKFDEWIGSTLVVLVLVVLFALYLGALDVAFSKLAKYIFKVYGGY